MEDLRAPSHISLVGASLKFGLCFVSCIAVPLAYVLFVSAPTPRATASAFVAFALYITLSTLFTPTPDVDKLKRHSGWRLGGDRLPWDDTNGLLMTLLILMLPGKFLGSGVVEMVHLIGGDAE